MWNGKNEVLFFSWNAPLKEVQPWCGGLGRGQNGLSRCSRFLSCEVTPKNRRFSQVGQPPAPIPPATWNYRWQSLTPEVPSSGRGREREKKLPTPTAEQLNEVCRYHETISWGVRGFVWGTVLALSEFLEKTRWYGGRKARRENDKNILWMWRSQGLELCA